MFHDIRLTEIIEQGAVGGPSYSTTVIESLGGFEQRNSQWQMPRCKWNLTHGIYDEDSFRTLLAFFHARKGRLYGFRFKDWSDYKAVAAPLVGRLDGKFQLYQSYNDGTYTTIRKITRPVLGSVTLTGGGSLDYSTGLVTGGTGGTWTGCFDLPVRFDSDDYSLTMTQTDIGSLQFNIIEIRE